MTPAPFDTRRRRNRHHTAPERQLLSARDQIAYLTIQKTCNDWRCCRVYDAAGRDVEEVYIDDGGIVRLAVKTEQDRLEALNNDESPRPAAGERLEKDPFQTSPVQSESSPSPSLPKHHVPPVHPARLHGIGLGLPDVDGTPCPVTHQDLTHAPLQLLASSNATAIDRAVYRPDNALHPVDRHPNAGPFAAGHSLNPIRNGQGDAPSDHISLPDQPGAPRQYHSLGFEAHLTRLAAELQEERAVRHILAKQVIDLSNIVNENAANTAAHFADHHRKLEQARHAHQRTDRALHNEQTSGKKERHILAQAIQHESTRQDASSTRTDQIAQGLLNMRMEVKDLSGLRSRLGELAETVSSLQQSDRRRLDVYNASPVHLSPHSSARYPSQLAQRRRQRHPTALSVAEHQRPLMPTPLLSPRPWSRAVASSFAPVDKEHGSTTSDDATSSDKPSGAASLHMLTSRSAPTPTGQIQSPRPMPTTPQATQLLGLLQTSRSMSSSPSMPADFDAAPTSGCDTAVALPEAVEASERRDPDQHSLSDGPEVATSSAPMIVTQQHGKPKVGKVWVQPPKAIVFEKGRFDILRRTHDENSQSSGDTESRRTSLSSVSASQTASEHDDCAASDAVSPRQSEPDSSVMDLPNEDNSPSTSEASLPVHLPEDASAPITCAPATSISPAEPELTAHPDERERGVDSMMSKESEQSAEETNDEMTALPFDIPAPLESRAGTAAISSKRAKKRKQQRMAKGARNEAAGQDTGNASEPPAASGTQAIPPSGSVPLTALGGRQRNGIRNIYGLTGELDVSTLRIVTSALAKKGQLTRDGPADPEQLAKLDAVIHRAMAPFRGESPASSDPTRYRPSATSGLVGLGLVEDDEGWYTVTGLDSLRNSESKESANVVSSDPATFTARKQQSDNALPREHKKSDSPTAPRAAQVECSHRHDLGPLAADVQLRSLERSRSLSPEADQGVATQSHKVGVRGSYDMIETGSDPQHQAGIETSGSADLGTSSRTDTCDALVLRRVKSCPLFSDRGDEASEAVQLPTGEWTRIIDITPSAPKIGFEARDALSAFPTTKPVEAKHEPASSMSNRSPSQPPSKPLIECPTLVADSRTTTGSNSVRNFDPQTDRLSGSSDVHHEYMQDKPSQRSDSWTDVDPSAPSSQSMAVPNKAAYLAPIPAGPNDSKTSSSGRAPSDVATEHECSLQ